MGHSTCRRSGSRSVRVPGVGALFARRMQELGKPADWTYEAVFAALIGGLVGSRLDYIIQNWDKVSGDVLGNVFSGSGLVFFGGLIGGAVGVLRGRAGGLPRLGAARLGRRPNRDRLRDRADRLPAVGRRRLRRALGPAVGDVLPEAPCRRPTRSTRRRSTRRSRWAGHLLLWTCATDWRRGCCSASTWSSPGWSASWSSSSAATTPWWPASRSRSCSASRWWRAGRRWCWPAGTYRGPPWPVA